MNIIEKKYNGKSVYYFDEYYYRIAIKLLNNEYKEIKKIKDTKRNLVSLIEIEGIKYIYKEPRNEFRIPQRQFMTFFKKGEALNTLININKMIEEYNIYDYVRPYLAIVKRSKNFINFSAILFEYIADGEELFDKDLEILVKKMQKIHDLGYYHGDFNPTNFLINKNNEIKILDTQAKKMGITKYRAHYDMLTMQENYINMKYPYSKTPSYFLALAVKKFKRLKWVSWIKEKKKKLRDKGWKI
ncbi:lipopolysaccharide biosynthesis protein [Fusobacterium gastrosuis]|uniref:lipopolysaccharide biosynthesis protein n=1 Tax=Fusobacterium gastrosuis TaxID=1755100 RepID=UPI002971336B|nr:lipopolysaccharide biosynthesis protein [Fusobacteriaceae bacterium]MDY5713157.1 lipopolysaccharide biosynthesis protein [Fusobacterium gastrosuis]